VNEESAEPFPLAAATDGEATALLLVSNDCCTSVCSQHGENNIVKKVYL